MVYPKFGAWVEIIRFIYQALRDGCVWHGLNNKEGLLKGGKSIGWSAAYASSLGLNALSHWASIRRVVLVQEGFQLVEIGLLHRRVDEAVAFARVKVKLVLLACPLQRLGVEGRLAGRHTLVNRAMGEEHRHLKAADLLKGRDIAEAEAFLATHPLLPVARLFAVEEEIAAIA